MRAGPSSDISPPPPPPQAEALTLGGGCVGLHPLPVLLPHLAELEAGVRYQDVCMGE